MSRSIVHVASELKFPECKECRFYKASRPSKVCGQCDSGEYFEEIVEEMRPENMIFSRMDRDDVYDE